MISVCHTENLSCLFRVKKVMNDVETTLNARLAEILDKTRRAWTVKPEQRRVLEGGGQIDVLVMEDGRPHVVIECKVGMMPEDVTKRFDNRFSDTGTSPRIVFEVKYPNGNWSRRAYFLSKKTSFVPRSTQPRDQLPQTIVQVWNFKVRSFHTASTLAAGGGGGGTVSEEGMVEGYIP